MDGEARGATKKQQIVKKCRMHNSLWSSTARYCFKEAGCREALLFLNCSPFPFPSASKGIKEMYSNEHRNASSSVSGTVQTALPPQSLQPSSCSAQCHFPNLITTQNFPTTGYQRCCLLSRCALLPPSHSSECTQPSVWGLCWDVNKGN